MTVLYKCYIQTEEWVVWKDQYPDDVSFLLKASGHTQGAFKATCLVSIHTSLCYQHTKSISWNRKRRKALIQGTKKNGCGIRIHEILCEHLATSEKNRLVTAGLQ